MRRPLSSNLKAILATLVVTATPVLAEDPPPFPEFKFKKVAPPTKRSGPRINIQIEPQPNVRVSVPETEEPLEGAKNAYGWFWSSVSPKLEDASPARLDDTLAALQDAERDLVLSPPRLDEIRLITDRYGKDILLATIGTRVSPALVAAIIHVESGGRADAVSTAGASGVMQLIPTTAERFGVDDITNPAQNIKGGVAYLDWLMEEFDLDPVMILAGYNAGENAVKSHKGVPPFSETRAYVPKVLSAWRVASGLCKTPPQFITDGCAFLDAKR